MIAIRLMSVTIIFSALIILRELINSRDGVLRRILISYFSVEVIVFGTLLFLSIKYMFSDYLVKVALVALIPKFIVKMFFLWFVLPKEKGRKLY